MCLISLIAFNVIFTTHPFKERPDGKKDMFSETFMYPRFNDLLKSSGENYKKISQEKYEEIIIKSNDGFNLHGYFIKNNIETQNTAIFVHGYQSEGFTDNSKHANKFLEQGYNVLLIDNRACGQSEGKYLTFGIKESEDLLLWCNEIAKRYPSGNIVLHGTSLGGATVSMASALDLPKQVKCIVSDCAFTSIKAEFSHVMKNIFHLPTWPSLNLMECWAKKIANFDFTSKSPINSVKNAKLPILFIHGVEDRFIDKSSAQILYDACHSEKDILFVKGCGHAESQLEDDVYYPKIFSYISKYIKNN